MGTDVHTLVPTTASPTLRGAPKDGSGEAVVACDTPEPCKFTSLDRCQKRFLCTHKEDDLAAHTVVGLVLRVRNAERFPQAVGFEDLEPFSGSMFHCHRGGWR